MGEEAEEEAAAAAAAVVAVAEGEAGEDRQTLPAEAAAGEGAAACLKNWQ